MNILVFGHTGQVATELYLTGKVTTLNRSQADLTNPAACADVIRARRPDAVINAAAYTAVDLAEKEPDKATQINTQAPGAMAQACADLDIPFVHISTDYVFDGSGTRPWAPDDIPAPLGVYGRSKYDGEQAVKSAGGRYVILRTSWVFSAHGGNFVKTMLRLGKTHRDLNVVADQIGGPTPARAIALACLKIAHDLAKNPTPSGIYHFAGRPNASWKDFADEIFQRAGLSVTVTGIPTSAYPTDAERPANSRLFCDDLATVFGIDCPDWHKGLDEVLLDISRSL